MRIDICSCEECVSDADVIIKFIKGGRLSLLCSIIPSIIIPERVKREVLRKISLSAADAFLAAIRQGSVRVIDTDSARDLAPEQVRSIAVFVESYSPFMHGGELRAAALGNELGIPIMLSDDRNAQSIIQERTSILVFLLYEVLALGIKKRRITEEEAVNAFCAINSLQEYPVTIPPRDLLSRAHKRLTALE
ncbi:MAG: hypothetical protein ACOX5M_08200 [Bacillota bacterium]|nr:hypothetical protein [Candidatus Fermentithermobacillaceae bacterium]